MIRFATSRDHPRLKALWAETFGDSQATVDGYFDLRHKDENMLVDIHDNTVAGMLSMLPVTLCVSREFAFSARYIYAVATDVRYRGRGISTALLEAAHTHMKGLGEAAGILVPASPSLFDFYKKRGYKDVFSLDIINVNAAQLKPFPPQGRFFACSAHEYTSLRNQTFQDSGLYVRWEESAVSYVMQTLAQTGGVTAISWENGQGCTAWEKTEEGILIRELALPQGDVRTALSVLHSQLNAKRYTVRLSEGTVPGVIPQPFGMIYWLTSEPTLAGKPPYLSLAKD